jgi:transposase
MAWRICHPARSGAPLAHGPPRGILEALIPRDGKGHGELARVGRQLGVHPEALRSWVKQAEIDGGERPGTTTGDNQRIAELEREVRELRRANEILKAASAYFARELDPRLPR